MTKQRNESDIITLPFSTLFLSPKNVRKSASGIEELAELILAEGVLQNLNVEAETKRGKTRYGVVAGGRRYRAVELLVKRKAVPKDFPMPCRIVAADKATSVSLMENSGREALHPADQFEAFRALIDQGKDEETVAALFGVGRRVVRQRLKLAAASPRLLEEYRGGGMDLEQLMALCLSDDHARQEQVWFESSHWQRQPHYLRQQLTVAEIPLSDPRAMFVGVEAYEAAGGAVRRDLFSDEDAGYLCDGELLNRLTNEKLASAAESLHNEGWLWVETVGIVDYSALSPYTAAPRQERPMTEEETVLDATLQREIEVLQGDIDALEESEDGDEDVIAEQLDRLYEQLQEKEAAQTELADNCMELTDTVRGQSGCVVGIERVNGSLRIVRGLLRPEDRKRVAQQAREAGPAGAADGATKPTHSGALTLALTAQRTIAIQVELARQPRVALALLATRLAASLLKDDHWQWWAMQVRADEPALARDCPEIDETRAHAALAELTDEWAAKLPATEGLLAWLLDQPEAIAHSLLAYCAARCFTAVQGGDGSSSSADAVAAALALDMADWWEPTAATYFSRVPKPRIVEVVQQVVSAEAAAPLAAMKKREAAQQAERLVQGSRWLPDCLQAIGQLG